MYITWAITNRRAEEVAPYIHTIIQPYKVQRWITQTNPSRSGGCPSFNVMVVLGYKDQVVFFDVDSSFIPLPCFWSVYGYSISYTVIQWAIVLTVTVIVGLQIFPSSLSKVVQPGGVQRENVQEWASIIRWDLETSIPKVCSWGWL